MKSQTERYHKQIVMNFLFITAVLFGASAAFADQGPIVVTGTRPTAATTTAQPAAATTQAAKQPAQPAATETWSSNEGKSWYSGLSGLFSELTAEDVGSKPRVKPHFYFNQGFVSNAQLASKQVDPAWQARVAPGITISLPWDRLFAEFDYTYGFSTTQGKKTHTNLNTHNFDALMRYQIAEKTSIGVSNNIQWSEIPGFPNDTFMLESLAVQLQHEFTDKLSANTQYTFQYFNDGTKSDSGTTRENDFADNGVSGAIDYDITDRIMVSPSFSWNIRDFKRVRQKDYWQISPVLATTVKLFPKTTVGGHLGWAFRQFREGDNHESELIYGSVLNHRMGRKFVWSVEYDKRLSDTYDTDFIYREDAETITLDNFDRNFRVLKNHRIGTTANYYFTEKLNMGIFGDFQFISTDINDNVITGKKNNEKTMEIGTSIAYRINRYFSLNLLYSFGRRFSANDEEAFTRRDYTFHKVTGGLSMEIG
ncbi:MAG TPA: hypothetical protein VD913_03375 [bacterium]|nr:hypothetical protein [bacterium]